MKHEIVTYARAGLVGHPSDHFNGKVIAYNFSDFKATAKIAPSDKTNFGSIGRSLMETSVKVFLDFIKARALQFQPKTFFLEIETNIPQMVGLAGSSALLVSIFKALANFHQTPITDLAITHLARKTENEALQNPTGWMDSVTQLSNGIVYMDFSDEVIQPDGHGKYEIITPKVPLNLYIAYNPNLGEISGLNKRDLRQRYEKKEPIVLEVKKLSHQIVDAAKKAIINGDINLLNNAINEGYELRKKIISVTPEHDYMVQTARIPGASATFAGSGGAITGMYKNERQFKELKRELKKIGCSVIKPTIV